MIGLSGTCQAVGDAAARFALLPGITGRNSVSY
ncbi:hypothetical protein FAES_3707 [Fibrella aestuarina BUZ 2]|uniref:Uncharacterized protein n=1 Tax=Fibrella aestuarina BUZ 2 TaxID=1166018 RepID=I0KC61_9BACT|nr:hypothetical protein FAES_3707 [Fibrella aestuarina BUZ 2]